MKKQNKPNFIFYVVLILIPILFFVILEFSLRIFNYGVDTSTWLKVTDDYYGLNPDVAKRYFYSVDNVPESIQDVFFIKKRPNTYRVFVLGGSSAAGYPFMPLGSFSRYIRQRLEQNYPKTNIEVVNISLTATNSYTILDLIPDVLKQKPDLILVYAGHNEYYGALGIGSMESLGKSRTIVNFVLSLNKFKTIQFLRNLIKDAASLLPDSNSKTSGTLMSKMAENQKIEYGSEVFELGIQQFKENMSDVIKLVKKNNVPIILSTLVSNLKDQPPFIYNATSNKYNAKLIYNKAKEKYALSNFVEADSLFRLAKDYDQLRFRAPERINKVINNFETTFNIPVLRADSILRESIEGKIIGDNLMVDHLHLSLEGNKILGEIFYDKINKFNLLPEGKSIYDYSKQDSITRKNFIYSKLDSTIADYKIKLLKNDWPFINVNQKKSVYTIIKPNTFIDSLALNFVLGKEEWETSHRKLAAYYLKKDDIYNVLKEYDLLIHQYPMIINYNRFIANTLMKKKRYSEAIKYLRNGNKLKPDAYFNKWLGIINLSNENVDTAIYYLEKSMKFRNNDSQVLFNLSGAYTKKQEYEKALVLVNECLRGNPQYKAAQNLQKQLNAVVNKR